MSLILEALRRSEAERRRGQVPGLHAERAPAALPAHATQPAWPWLALAIIVLLAAAWFARSAWSPPPVAGEKTVTLEAGPAADAARPAGMAADATHGATGAERSANASIGAAPPTPAIPAPPPPPATATATSVAALSPNPADPARTDASAPRAMPSPRAVAPAPAVANGGDAPKPATTPAGTETKVAIAPQPTPAVVTVAAPARTPDPPSPSAPVLTTPPASPATASPMRLADLGTAERLELPPLKISMHLWDPAPARRFAIIDGARVNEGDRLGDAVVEEITTNAVVLAWRGQRLRIELR